MRWLASLVVLALVAATGARSVQQTVRAADGHAQKIEAADGVVALTARRAGVVAPDLRTQPSAIAAVAPAMPAPPRARVADAANRLVHLLPLDARVATARGPPDDRFLVAENRSSVVI
jgi:hypothetical protein